MERRGRVVLMSLGVLASCASLEGAFGNRYAAYVRATSGPIGCPVEEVLITSHSDGWGANSWTAECRGRRYICSEVGSVTCTPDSTQAMVPAAGPGCAYDTQCKGDRLCRQGVCVAPPDPGSPPPPPPPAQGR